MKCKIEQGKFLPESNRKYRRNMEKRKIEDKSRSSKINQRRGVRGEAEENTGEAIGGNIITEPFLELQ